MDSRQKLLVVKRSGAVRDFLAYGFALFMFTGVFLLFLVVAIHDLGKSDRVFSIALTVFFGVGALFSGCGLLRQISGGKAAFDASTGTVRFSRLFSRPRTLRFDDIARIAPITSKSPLFTRHGYCVVPRNEPVFGVILLSSFFRKNSRALQAFQSNTLPAVGSMMDLPTDKADVKPSLKHLEDAGYHKELGSYVKSYAKRLTMSMLAGLIILFAGGNLLGAEENDLVGLGLILAVAAIALLFFTCFFPVRSIAIDPAKRTVEVKNGLLPVRSKTYPFSSIEYFEVTSFYGSWFVRNNKNLSLKFRERKKPLLLSAGGMRSRNKLHAELFALAFLLEMDPIESIHYIQRRIGGSLFSSL